MTIALDEYPYELPCAACGQAVFYLQRKPVNNETLASATAIYSDGSKPALGERVVCPRCRREVQVSELKPSRVQGRLGGLIT
jgi:hypothetical protein